MPLAPTLKTPSDLLNKLAREQYRAFHSRHLLHKADHLYNYCVTASAMRDYIFEYFGITEKKLKEPFEKEWAKSIELVAAIEIANKSKHFILRDPSGKPRK
ncbi:MAG: hypothetical protein NT030_08515 [Candidatus Saganbacteria bacterium]|nr:hypothetical protein [Candidatus Saganbacteria bacterium]